MINEPARMIIKDVISDLIRLQNDAERSSAFAQWDSPLQPIYKDKIYYCQDHRQKLEKALALITDKVEHPGSVPECCTCHTGHPPCPFCEQLDPDEIKPSQPNWQFRG